MNNRDQFNAAIAQTTDPDTIARLELAREYFTTPGFRKALEESTWKANQGTRQ